MPWGRELGPQDRLLFVSVVVAGDGGVQVRLALTPLVAILPTMTRPPQLVCPSGQGLAVPVKVAQELLELQEK
jgi:hypothetical protein